MKWTLDDPNYSIKLSIYLENLVKIVFPTCYLLLLMKNLLTILVIYGKTLSWFFCLKPSIEYLTLHWLWKIINCSLLILSKLKWFDFNYD